MVAVQKRCLSLPRHTVGMFVLLQLGDIVTTLVGLNCGIGEANGFAAKLMQSGVLEGLFLLKLLSLSALLLPNRLVALANLWFIGIVCWNVFALAIRA